MTTEPTAPALPGWDEMTDLDKGAALLHLHKRDWEGADYAVENYPARYFDHPALTSLSREDACRHAASLEDAADMNGPDENERLYDLALDTERKRDAAPAAGSSEPPVHVGEGITGLHWDNLGSGGGI